MDSLFLYLLFIIPFIGFLAIAGWVAERIER